MSSKKTMGDFVEQVYVVHSSGIVLLSKKYASSCIASDSQLVGGFLTALLLFMQNSQGKQKGNCKWEPDGIHKLRDIGMSCSRWFIKGMEEYTVAILIPNKSLLIQDSKYEIINELADNIISSFLLFTTFGLADDLNDLRDLGNDFGQTIDNLIFESLNDYVEMGMEIEVEGELEIFDAHI